MICPGFDGDCIDMHLQPSPVMYIPRRCSLLAIATCTALAMLISLARPHFYSRQFPIVQNSQLASAVSWTSQCHVFSEISGVGCPQQPQCDGPPSNPPPTVTLAACPTPVSCRAVVVPRAFITLLMLVNGVSAGRDRVFSGRAGWGARSDPGSLIPLQHVGPD